MQKPGTIARYSFNITAEIAKGLHKEASVEVYCVF